MPGGPWPLGAVASRPGPGRERLLRRIWSTARAAGEPLQYVLGRWGFRRLDLMVDRRVLIPRPETEQVVEAALAELARRSRLPPSRGDATRRRRSRHRLRRDRPVARARDGPAGGVGDRRVGRRPGRGPGQPGRSGRPGRHRVRLAEGAWWSAPSGRAARAESTSLVSNPPYIATARWPASPKRSPSGSRCRARGRPHRPRSHGADPPGAGPWLRPGAALVPRWRPTRRPPPSRWPTRRA